MAIRSVIISPLSKWECRHRYTPGLFQCVEHMDTNGVRRGKGEREREMERESRGRGAGREETKHSFQPQKHGAPSSPAWGVVALCGE